MDAIHRAKEIRTEFGISGRVKVEALAERLGLKTYRRSFRGSRVQEMTIGRRIAVGDHLDPGEIRWAIGHGIGHAVLHGDSPNLVLLSLVDKPRANQAEVEAEYFAYHLLVDDSLNAGLPENWEVAAYYGVPIRKMVFRAFGGFA